MMNYPEIKEMLLSSEVNKSIPGLSRIKAVLDYLGNPQNELKVIHVVGSNGKGSVSRMLSEILTISGYKTGLFTSPYITELTEYMFINNLNISKSEFADYGSRIVNVLNETHLQLTHFEFVTVAAVLCFFENKCDICIFEAGMGGASDATNIFNNSLCNILTSVSIEHSAYLGNSLEEIVNQKLGIAVAGETVVASDYSRNYENGNELCNAQAGQIIYDYCLSNNLTLYGLNQKIFVLHKSIDKLQFSYGNFKNIVLNTGALYQIKNATTVIEACNVLNGEYNISHESVIKGLEKFQLKARFEIVYYKPLIIIDGGHNPACATELVKSLEKDKKYIFVTGVMADKDYNAIYEQLIPYAKCFICVDNGIERALKAEKLCGYFADLGVKAYCAGNTFNAAALIKTICDQNDSVVYMGTLYMSDSFRDDINIVYNEERLTERCELVVERLTSKSFFSKNYSLPDMKTLLAEFGHPQNKLKCIHVAGTNGKGSVCSMIYTVLEELGFKTGLFTSPYLTKFNERIQFHNNQIEDSMLTAIGERVFEAQNRLNIDLNQFALVTCIAIIYYDMIGVDFVVLETGLGGTYDPTNIVPKPVCTAITNIGYDHTEVLGNTIEEIAAVKAGIIKENVPIVCYPVTESALNVIRQKAEEKKAPLYYVSQNMVSIKSSDQNGTVFSYGKREYKTPLTGDFQAYNSAVAITVLHNLYDISKDLTCDNCTWKNKEDFEQIVVRGLKKTSWKGRLELVSLNPLCYVDGGHNPQCIEAVTEYFNLHYPEKKKIYIAGFMRDKNYETMINKLSENADLVYLVPVKNSRSLNYFELTEVAKRYTMNTSVLSSLEEALSKAMEAQNDSIVCIIGSIYQIGDLYNVIESMGGLYERGREDSPK